MQAIFFHFYMEDFEKRVIMSQPLFLIDNWVILSGLFVGEGVWNILIDIVVIIFLILHFWDERPII